MSRFTKILLVSPLPDGNTWIIQRDFGYDVGSENSNNSINIPIGFLTDFTSVPRVFWSILPKWGKYGNAAVVHDYCYWEQKFNRKEADDIFREAMHVLNVSKWQIFFIYYAVRGFGWYAWEKNKKLKSQHQKNRFIAPKKADDINISKL